MLWAVSLAPVCLSVTSEVVVPLLHPQQKGDKQEVNLPEGNCLIFNNTASFSSETVGNMDIVCKYIV
jgi:hypothetical protein